MDAGVVESDDLRDGGPMGIHDHRDEIPHAEGRR
jgi:hypothetical protein